MISGGVYFGPLNSIFYDVKSGVLDLGKQRFGTYLGKLNPTVIGKIEGEPLQYRVFFGDFWLNDGKNFFITDYSFLDSREKYYDYNVYKNRGFFYGEKRTKGVVKIRGYIKASNRNELTELALKLKNQIVMGEKELRIYENEKGKWVKAICNKVDYQENRYNVNWIDFEILFEYIDVWKDTGMKWTYFGNVDALNIDFFVDTREDTPAIIYFKPSVLNTGQVKISINSEEVIIDGVENGIKYKYDSGNFGIFKAVGRDMELVEHKGIVSDFKPGINKVIIEFEGFMDIGLAYYPTY